MNAWKIREEWATGRLKWKCVCKTRYPARDAPRSRRRWQNVINVKVWMNANEKKDSYLAVADSRRYVIDEIMHLLPSLNPLYQVWERDIESDVDGCDTSAWNTGWWHRTAFIPRVTEESGGGWGVGHAPGDCGFHYDGDDITWTKPLRLRIKKAPGEGKVGTTMDRNIPGCCDNFTAISISVIDIIRTYNSPIVLSQLKHCCCCRRYY